MKMSSPRRWIFSTFGSSTFQVYAMSSRAPMMASVIIRVLCILSATTLFLELRTKHCL